MLPLLLVDLDVFSFFVAKQPIKTWLIWDSPNRCHIKMTLHRTVALVRYTVAYCII